MKRAFFLLGCLVFGGCQSAPVAPSVQEETMLKRFISISQIHTGQTRAQVNELLGKEIVTGYSLSDEQSGEYTPVVIPNPHRTETIQNDRKSYVVDYYLVGIKVTDEKITDDELIPMVFLKDKLVGMGWSYFNQRVKVAQ